MGLEFCQILRGLLVVVMVVVVLGWGNGVDWGGVERGWERRV